MMLGLAGLSMAAQAQVVASLGFEDGDHMYHNPDSAQFASFYADHINLYRGDTWTEKSAEAHSGSYALEAVNSTEFKGNTWDRGIKLRGLEIEPQTSYRVSFWVKADRTYKLDSEPDSEYDTSIKSSLSIGIENLEAPFMSQSGTQYYYNWTSGMTGEWRRLSYVSYYSGPEVQNKFFDDFNNNIKEIVVNDPDDPSKNDTIYWGQEYSQFPDEFFVTINMYNPGTYYLDDIQVEKATMAGCYYNYDFVKIDFGYPTNIAELAAASQNPMGTLSLPVSCVKVMKGDQELEVSAVEGKADGGLYIFMVDAAALEDGSEDVRVSFTPPADCPIIYTTDQRPSMDVESRMVVLPFEDERIYLDESLDVLPSSWDAPNYLSSVPENGSFELESATLTQIVATYDREVDLSTASATLSSNGINTDLTGAMSVSEDGCSVIVAVDNLADGEYLLTLNGVANAMSGAMTLEDQVIKFSVGKDTDESVSENIYVPDFTAVQAGTFPKGWISNDEGEVHEYGINDDGSIYNYDYGGKNPMGYQGGPRMFEGFSGDFTKAIYWRSVAGNGFLSYGEQVKDYMQPDGSVDESMDPEIALYLEAKKHEVSFRMAAWKGEPVFNFTLEDLDGNVVARFDKITAKPNMNGAKAEVNGSVELSTEFTVPEAGYYMMRFSTEQGTAWNEFLLANVKLITKPSDAAYYRQLLGEAVDSANVVLNMAADAVYDGTTKTALTEKVTYATETHFTSPTEVNNLMAELYALSGTMLKRITNIDNYSLKLVDLQNAMGSYAGTKYVTTDDYMAAEALLNEYQDVDATTLDDETLNDVTAELVHYAALVPNIQKSTDALTYRLDKAVESALILDSEAEDLIFSAQNAVEDDDRLVDQLNDMNKYALYKILAANTSVPDDYKTVVKSETKVDEGSGDYVELTSGIELTGFVKNPHFYTYLANGTDSVNAVNTPGWNVDGYVHVSGDGDWCTREDLPVTNSRINGYRSQFSVYQRISRLPAGVYDICLRTRTAPGMNAVNDETGRPDMFMWVSTAEGDTLFTAYEEGQTVYDGVWGGYPTVIKNVKVDENTVLTIGAKEAYTSGKNIDPETNEDKGVWDTNTYVDDARLFLVAPLEGFDYSEALLDISDVQNSEAVSYEYYTVDGIRLDRPAKGLNIVKVHRADGSVTVEKVMVK